MTERKQVEREADSRDADDGSPHRWTIADFRKWLDEAATKVPPEHRGSTYVELRASGDYATAYLEIAFVRPENDAEFAERDEWQRRYEDEKEERDRREFARLTAKYVHSGRNAE